MAKHDKTQIGVSTILNPVPVVMVSCCGKDKSDSLSRPDIVTVAWTGTVNSEPPMLSISLRKSRHSHLLISDTREFVVNLVSKSLAKSCDFCGVKSGRDIDKFEATGLTAIPAEGMNFAVAIKESPVNISCRVRSVTELGSHDLFIADIVAVNADSYLLDDTGRLNLDKAMLVSYNHGEYFLPGKKIGFFGYSVASEDVIKRRLG